ncbi:NUDIX domain-containing protein [Salibacterium aidingense]|uniref:NUDIX domain-containing protein n=1 Tax=Salibacterium aidingense TaxID=384933 RepID=UPI0003FAD3B6|nr:NUDIX domain-containing protein [Salibacterium aidingense]
MNQSFQAISNKDMQRTLENTARQYLAGNLQRPQELSHFPEENVEIGITSYDTFTSEKSHYHIRASEYMYIISGMTEYMEVDTKQTYMFRKGDFFQIRPGTSYAQRSKPGTALLFIKTPPGNDKVVVEETREVTAWRETPLETTRTDYQNDPEAPVPNGLKPAAAAAIVNDKQEILVVRRRDNGKWTLPGGTMDVGEDLKSCAVREVQEESGYTVEITGIIGTYSNPNTVIAYSDGEVRQEFLILYKARIVRGRLQLDEESTDWAWVSLEKAGDLPMTASQKQRLEDIKVFERDGMPFFR